MTERAIHTIMTPNPITIGHNSKLQEATHLMKKNNIRHLPVLKNAKLVGIVSLTDLQRMSFADEFSGEENIDAAIFNMLRVNHVMVSRPISVQADSTIRDAAKILASKEFHALPVVEGENVVGIITTTDLIKYFLENC